MKAPRIWKVCVIGDRAVGKTSIIRRFVYNAFDEDPEETLTTQTFKKKCKDVMLMIWDVSVYEKNIVPVLAGAKAIVIVGDLTRKETYDTMTQIAQFLDEHKAMKIFVANKTDLKYKAQFWKGELQELSDKFGIPYILTSAKTGENVTEIFRNLLEM